MTKRKKPGQPTKYKKDYNEQVTKLCLLGATDEEIADFFDVCVSTIDNWKNDYPLFLGAIKEGKEIADAKVTESLFNRALGYSHKDTHISNYQGEITKTEITKHYPPDATSAIFWLKNRQKNKWRDKQDVTVSGDPEKPLQVTISPTEKLKAFLNGQSKPLRESGESSGD